MLHDQALRAHGQNLLRGTDQVGVPGQQLGFAIVDQQSIQTFQNSGQILAMIVDPVIHGVAADQLYLRHLLRTFSCSTGSIFARKRNSLSWYSAGIFGVKRLKDIELGVQRLCFVQVLQVRSTPEKALARNVLDAARIDAAPRQDGLVFRGKVFADYGNDPHIGKVACGQSKISRRSAQAAFCAA